MTTDPSWARVGVPLEAYAAGFRVELGRLGYTPLTAAGHVRLMAHLARWLAAEGLDAAALTPATVEAYFAQRRTVGYVNERTSRALRPLLGYLRALGVVPVPAAAVPATEVERLLQRYRVYLTDERGLAAATVELNVRLVRPFLLQRAKAHRGRLDLQRVTADDVRAFVLAQSRLRPRSVRRTVTALRSLLGFLHVEGITSQSLAAAVPAATGWTLTGLPKALDDKQVRSLLAGCDQRTATGCRDLAILTVLLRLGLRVGEVAALGLDDIDWRRGEITVHGKGNRVDRLPLPVDVGQRIVTYLQDGRPNATQDRAVFLGAQAPHRPLTSTAVSTLVEVAGRRAGLGLIGAHRLRHTAATAMLRSGASLTEIGQALRHERPLTTAIYAKVDFEALRVVARPWPGESA